MREIATGMTAKSCLILALVASASVGVYAAVAVPQAVTSRSGGDATVCGSVVSARQDVQFRGEPVLLTLGHAYDGRDLTVVILGEDRAKVRAPAALIGRRVCASGPLRNFLGAPRMVPAALVE